MIKSGKAIEEVGHPFWLIRIKLKSNYPHPQFLDNLTKTLLPIGLKERETLLAFKHVDCASKNLPLDDKYYTWDDGYYNRKLTEQTLEIDSQLVKEHFPVEKVVPAVLEMYQEMFGVRFEKREGASVWHPGEWWTTNSKFFYDLKNFGP